jgi:hypothetical protein
MSESRMALPDGTSIPESFEGILPGDYVASAKFPWLNGHVLSTILVGPRQIPGVLIQCPMGSRRDVILSGDIAVCGYVDLVL